MNSNTIRPWWRCSREVRRLSRVKPLFSLSHTQTHIHTQTHTKFNHVSAAAWGNSLWKPHYSGKSPFPCYFTQQHLRHTLADTHLHSLSAFTRGTQKIWFFFLTLCGADLTPSCLSQPEVSEEWDFYSAMKKKNVPQRVNVILWQYRVCCCKRA